MADRSQAKVTRALRNAGFWTFKAQDAVWTKGFAGKKLALPEEPGKADLIVARNGVMIFVEVKDAGLAFPFASWRDNQREWARATWDDFRLDYALAITLGTDPPNRDPERYAPERLWIVPRFCYESIEALVEPYQSSLPYRVGPGYNRVLQDNNYDAVHLFADYALTWEKGVFTFPRDHWLLSYLQGGSDDIPE